VGAASRSAGRPLWAPWRVDYIEGEHGPRGCIFCEPAKPVPDRERLILFRGRHVFVLLNRYPYAAGHLMVAPDAHLARLHDLDEETRVELMARVTQSAEIVEKTFACEGLNIGANLGTAAGAGFADHLHFHIVPRWSGDVNFMTSIGELRVIPTHIERTYERLLPAFEALGAR
jgi:ATP adenylyltransferase